MNTTIIKYSRYTRTVVRNEMNVTEWELKQLRQMTNEQVQEFITDNADRGYGMNDDEIEHIELAHFAETEDGDLLMDMPIGHTVMLLYPESVSGYLDASIYVEFSSNEDPVEAVKEVRQKCVTENTGTDGECAFELDDLRCIGAIRGEHCIV